MREQKRAEAHARKSLQKKGAALGVSRASRRGDSTPVLEHSCTVRVQSHRGHSMSQYSIMSRTLCTVSGLRWELPCMNLGRETG